MTVMHLICSDVDLLREPVTCRTEGSSNVTSFHHLHQVSDDLMRISLCTVCITGQLLQSILFFLAYKTQKQNVQSATLRQNPL